MREGRRIKRDVLGLGGLEKLVMAGADRRQEGWRGTARLCSASCQFNSGKPGVCNSPHVGGKHMQNGANEQKGKSLGKFDV